MSFIDVWNTPEGKYAFGYALACFIPLLLLVAGIAYGIADRNTG